jgi:hypothetical protein
MALMRAVAFVALLLLPCAAALAEDEIPADVMAADWPDLPGTALLPAQVLRIGNDEDASFVLALDLPQGWKLTEGAPSAVRIEIGTTVTDAAIAGARSEVVLPSLEEGTLGGRLRLLYDVCQDAGQCRMRSVSVPLTVEVVAGAKTPVLRDRFEP